MAFYFKKKLGKVAYFFKSSCLSKKKTEGTFLRKKNLYATVYIDISKCQHLLLGIMASLLG